jgi:hypothetical protein
VHNSPCFISFEFVLALHFVVELTSFQEFHHDVKGVLRLENLMKFHAEFVVQTAHDFDLFNKAFLAFVLAISRFFRKGLHSEVSTSFQFFCQIN